MIALADAVHEVDGGLLAGVAAAGGADLRDLARRASTRFARRRLGAAHKRRGEDRVGLHLGVAAQLGHQPPLRGDDRRVVRRRRGGGCRSTTCWGASAPGPSVRSRIFRPRAASVVMGRPRLSPPVSFRSVAASASATSTAAARPPHRQRPAHDRHGEAMPRAGDVLCRAALEDPPRDHAQAVDAAAHHGQERRQEGGRGGDRHERDEQPADAHRAHERQRHEDEQRQADRDGQPREERRAARRAHRLDERVVRVVVELELLAEAEDDEHRVVDRDREADERDDVRHVDAMSIDVGEDPHEAERRRDA